MPRRRPTYILCLMHFFWAQFSNDGIGGEELILVSVVLALLVSSIFPNDVQLRISVLLSTTAFFICTQQPALSCDYSRFVGKAYREVCLCFLFLFFFGLVILWRCWHFVSSLCQSISQSMIAIAHTLMRM
jgi:hypothetical protein